MTVSSVSTLPRTHFCAPDPLNHDPDTCRVHLLRVTLTKRLLSLKTCFWYKDTGTVAEESRGNQPWQVKVFLLYECNVAGNVECSACKQMPACTKRDKRGSGSGSSSPDTEPCILYVPPQRRFFVPPACGTKMEGGGGYVLYLNVPGGSLSQSLPLVHE